MVLPETQESQEKTQLDPYVKRQIGKLTQVIQNFFTKSVQIVVQSRLETEHGQASTKVNKWFNLNLRSDDFLRDDLRLWKSVTDLGQIPPMIIEMYLDLRNLTSRQIVVLKDDNGHPWTVSKGGSRKHEVVLERWLVEFDASSVTGTTIDELPLIYKQAVVLFRSLYAYTRLMPLFKLKRDLNKSKLSKYSLKIESKILDGKQPISSKGRIGLSKSIIPHQILMRESHMSQKHFLPIRTTLGTLKVSVAYRNNCDFATHDNEELLSTHFLNIDSEETKKDVASTSDDGEKQLDVFKYSDYGQRKQSLEENHEQEKPSDQYRQSLKRFSTSSNASISITPCSSASQVFQSDSPSEKKFASTTPPVSSQRPPIKPFKIGSISSSPPPIGGPYGVSLERRISITSNKSTSNASLAAMLRNPKGSTTSAATNIPIAGASGTAPYTTSVPRSVSSSHGSNFVHDNDNAQPSSNPDSNINTPRFSSSFGSRASRRFSNTSIRQNSIPGGTIDDTSVLAGSAGLGSSEAPASGLYIDDDISEFVKMIDSKSDLRMSGYGSNNESKSSYQQGSNSQIDALNRFQLMKSQHQQLSDSVTASLMLQYNQSTSSRPSSRKSSHSVSSPPPSLPSGSYDNSHLPSIHSRLKDEVKFYPGGLPSRKLSAGSYSPHDPSSSSRLPTRDSRKPLQKSDSRDDPPGDPPGDAPDPGKDAIVSRQSMALIPTDKQPSSASSYVSAPVTATTKSHARIHTTNTGSGVSGLATTPSVYASKPDVTYEDVFDDDDEEGEDFYIAKTNYKADVAKQRRPSGNPAVPEDDDDDLLFTMSDMHLAKH